MKKLLTLLTLLVCAITGINAQDPTLPAKGTPSGALDVLTGDANVTAAFSNTNNGKKYLTYDLGTEIRTNVVKNGKANWAAAPANDGGSSVSSITFADDVTDAEKYGFKTSSLNKWGINSGRYCGFRVVNCVEAAVSTKSNGTKDGKTLQIQVYIKNGDKWDYVETIGASKYNNSKAYVLTTSALDADEEYVILLTSGSTSNSDSYEIRFAANATPILTGAWKIGEDEVTSNTVVQGSAAPTVPTFTVGATSGTPAASDYNVVYSLKEGSQAGIFTFTPAGGPTAISTATAGTATIVATLTTADAENYLTPATNTFEYAVTVSAAHAPVISVTGAGNVERGGELTLTAEVTDAVPSDYTINWYACNQSGTISGESLGTELTYSPSTETVGIYYFRAVVNNGVGGDANHDVLSEVQTVYVAPLAPTFSPVAGPVTAGTVVTISSTDDGSKIYYTTDGTEPAAINELEYTAPIVVNADMTIKAIVVKSNLQSTVASAAYNIIVLEEQTDVTSAKVWDWSKLTYTNNDGSNNGVLLADPLLNTDVVMSNINQYGYTITAPAAFDMQNLLVNCQYAVRNANSAQFIQANKIQFNTTLAGTLTVEYANTGNNAARTVKVNSSKGSKSSTANNSYQSESFDVEAGSVEITGVQVSDDAAKMLRIRKVVFMPYTTTVTTAGWATATTPAFAVDFDANAEVYIATAVGDAITLTKITDAPANTPVIVNAPSGSYTMTAKATATSDVSANLLKSSDGSIVGTATGSPYVLGKNSSDVVGFGPLADGTTLAAGKAYILASAFDSAKEFYPFVIDGEESGETDGIAAMELQHTQHSAAYNLAGQKVDASYKGIVIVNGKKVKR